MRVTVPDGLVLAGLVVVGVVFAGRVTVGVLTEVAGVFIVVVGRVLLLAEGASVLGAVTVVGLPVELPPVDEVVVVTGLGLRSDALTFVGVVNSVRGLVTAGLLLLFPLKELPVPSVNGITPVSGVSVLPLLVTLA